MGGVRRPASEQLVCRRGGRPSVAGKIEGRRRRRQHWRPPVPANVQQPPVEKPEITTFVFRLCRLRKDTEICSMTPRGTCCLKKLACAERARLSARHGPHQVFLPELPVLRSFPPEWKGYS